MELEILHGPASYDPESLFGPAKTSGPAPHFHRAPKAPPSAGAVIADESIPESRCEYAEIYSTKHERLLLRVDHIAKMDAIRKSFNASRIHDGQRALNTSDIITAVLDFAFEHRIPFYELKEADGLKDLISKGVYRSVLSRWRQFNERFD